MTLKKVLGLFITVILGVSVGLGLRDSSEVSVDDTQSKLLEEKVDKPYLVAEGFTSGENVITLNSNHPLLKEIYHFFKLEPGSYNLKCELTNPKIPFAMILFQGTETINDIDVNGNTYQTFPELESFYFEDGGQMQENITIDQDVYFQGSDNAIFSFYKLD